MTENCSSACWQAGGATAFELGLRWDRQTYTEPNFDDQFSPRISLLHSLNNSTELRLTWDRYYQSQAIQELQVEDDDYEFVPIPGPRNAEQLGTFATIDFRISREFPVRIGRLSGFFEVTNATNRKNECCIDYDLDEDDDGNVYLDRTLDHWLPIIPAIGVLWEF